MLNRELRTVDGITVYPEFITQTEKKALYEKYGEQTGYMCCCCRPEAKLYYRISKDYRIYPEHQGYIHDTFCIFANRGNTDKKLGYDIDAESGAINVNFKFKANTFTPPQDTIRTAPGIKMPTDRADFESSDLSLSAFIHDLFADVFNERSSQGKSALSSDYFMSSVYARLKRVYVNGVSKNLKDCTLDEDNFQFFLMKYNGFTLTKENDREVCFLNAVFGEGKQYKWFTYKKLYDKVAKEFFKAYGFPLTETGNENVYVAGFRYKVKKYKRTDTYNAVGRLTAFIVNDNGLHCRNVAEKLNLNSIIKELRFANGKYFVGGTDDFYDGFFDSADGRKAIIVSDPPIGLNEDYRVIKYDITKNTIPSADIKQLLFKE